MNIIEKFEDFNKDEFIHKPTAFSIDAGHEFNVKDKIISFEIGLAEEDFTKIKFVDCVFKEAVIFVKCSVFEEFEFINCTFEKEFILRDIKIHGSARFWCSKFNNKFKINNVRFEKLADFYQTKFADTFILYKVDFFGTTVFTEAIFNNTLLFTYTKITDFLLFTRTIFKEGIDLSLALISGKIIYFESQIVNFKNYRIHPIENQNDYINAVEENGKIPIFNKLETFRILKKHAKNNDNQILAIEFEKKEIETYAEILKFKKGNHFDSKAIFTLNKISNNHTTSWVLGIFFTLGVGLLFFYLAILNTEEYYFSICTNLSFDEIKIIISKYFNFLLPTHKFEDISSSKEPFFYLFDLLGRIFIGYGIYQTIQAFRKYK